MDGTPNRYNLRRSRIATHRHGGGPFVVLSPLVGGSAPPGSSSSDAHRPRSTCPAGVETPRKASAKTPGCSLRAVRIVAEKCDRVLRKREVGRIPEPTIAGRSGRGTGRPKDRQVTFNSAISTAISTASSSEPSSANTPTPHVDLPLDTIDIGTSGMSAHHSSFKQNSTTGIRIMQLNMQRSRIVTGEVRQLVAEKRLDVLLLQEPYVRKQGQGHTFYGLGVSMRIAAVRSQRPWTAVAVCSPRLDMLFVSQLSTTHCVCVEVQAPNFSFYVASCYFQYSDDIEKHLGHLETVFRSLRGKRLVVAIDANARSSLWGPQETDEKGAKVEELIRAFGLIVINRANQPPTFWTTRGSSYIDVTLASPSMTQFIGEWSVREDWTTSDHRSIDIRIRAPRASGGNGCAANMRFDIRRADWERFSKSLFKMSQSRLEVIELTSGRQVEILAEELSIVLRDACSSAMPRKRQFRKSNPWWTVELTRMKKTVYRHARAYRREKDQILRVEKLVVYRSSLRTYSRAIKKQKKVSWQKFVTDSGNKNPWGFAYRLQADKLRIGKVLSSLRLGEYSTMTLEETAKGLLDTHIPEDRSEEDSPEQRAIREGARFAPNTADAPLITVSELASVVKTFINAKAPGPDLIEVCVLKKACKIVPGQLVRLFNGCLQWGVFPAVWKEGSLRVLLKGEDKDEKDPKSYRPICLLSVIGKLFEKLLKSRLLDTSLAPGRVSDRQFGFTPGRSAEDAIVELRRMVAASQKRYAVALLFDISGAFDNVWWPLVLDSLRERECPKNVFGVLQSYFDDRRVSISEISFKVTKWATRGCPQGSVLGPACWNLMFDGLLRLLEQSIGNNFVAYADDLLVLLEGDSRRDIEIQGQRVVDRIVGWCRFAKLQLSEQKTEAILLQCSEIRRAPIGRRGGARPDRKRKPNTKKIDFGTRPPIIRLGNSKIKFKDEVRYLGVHFNKGMSVNAHCRYLERKVTSLFQRLGNLARAEWGLRNRTLSIIYEGVFVPTVAYAAAGWADLCTEREIRILRTAQRKVLINITGAYRTSSFESLCVLASKVPVDILLQRNRAIYAIRKGKDAEIGNIEISANMEDARQRAQVEAVNMWQAEWSASSKGRTTAAFFGKVHDRVDKPWIRPNYWVSQALTGHGDFRARLTSLGLVDNGTCASCNVDDTVQHFLLECTKFEPQRVALRDTVPVGEWQWPQVAQFFVSTSDAYSVFADFCRESLWIKGQEI